jgi:hypothetical protein
VIDAPCSGSGARSAAAGGDSVDAKLRLLVEGPALAVADTREIAAIRINLRI